MGLRGRCRRRHAARCCAPIWHKRDDGGSSGATSSADGIAVPPTSLSRLLRGAGFTVKKTLLASETDRADIVRARPVWHTHRQPWMMKRPERLVFIDETGTTTKMTRLRGWARRGQRLKMKAPFGHWGAQTFIAALRYDGLTAPWVIDRPMNRKIFEAYVEIQLAPTLKKATSLSSTISPARKARKLRRS